MYLFFDTETTGLPKKWNVPVSQINNWPRLVQLAFLLHDDDGKELESGNFIIRPDGFYIPFEASMVHGITTERALLDGIPITDALCRFDKMMQQSHSLVGHNISFDEKIVGAEYIRNGRKDIMLNKNKICTMYLSADYCNLKNKYGSCKWPKLSELYYKLFNTDFAEAHNASADIRATAKCFWELKRIGIL
jgi:DNA polymerase III epsilon subunit-like protein